MMGKGEDRYKKADDKKPQKNEVAAAARVAETAGGDKKPDVDTGSKPEAATPTAVGAVLSDTHRRHVEEMRSLNTRHEREHKELRERHMTELGGGLTADDLGMEKA